MNKFLNHTTAALTVGLLCMCSATASYSDNRSHGAIVDAYDSAYGEDTGAGMIARTDGNGDTTIRLFGVKDDPVRICSVFSNMSDHIIVIDSKFNEIHYDCSL